MTVRTLTLTISLALLGCGGSTESVRDTPPSEDELPAPPRPWAEMDHRARQQWMYAEVEPRMHERFEAWRPADHEEGFGCSTCHGSDADARRFAMPNPELPALPPTGTPAQRRMAEEHADAVEFMHGVVVPTMQRLLGAQPYDEATGEGFGCFDCHPRAGDEAGPAVAEAGAAEGEGP